MTAYNLFKTTFLSAVLLLFSIAILQAGVPMNNLEGAGGIAFNPLAYPAGQNAGENGPGPVSKLQFGVWYVNLDQVSVDWTSIGLALSLGGRLELSYGHEIVAPATKNIHKNNLGMKFLLVKENSAGHNWIPAISAGLLWKRTSNVAEPTENSSADYYLVATKLITQTAKPILLSAGFISTEGMVTGVFGYADERDQTFFANFDILPVANAALGLEYKQGASVKGFKNANYWNAHLAWFADSHLSLIAAYVHAGDQKSTSRVGLGDGVVFSAQYAF
jgi:hypothetical protein